MFKILLFIFLSLQCTMALASKARMEGLSQSSASGSYYIQDTRSAFSNPASLNGTKNYIITEWGEASDNSDDSTAPHAEGGLVGEAGNFTYGLYLGSELRARNSEKNTDFAKQDNRTDIFFAGDAGIEWGFRGHFASRNDESGAVDKKNTAFGLGLGIIRGPFEMYGNLDLRDESKGAVLANDSWEAELGINAGASFSLRSYTFFGEYNQSGYKQSLNLATTEQSVSEFILGIGKISELDGKTRIFSDIMAMQSTIKNVGGASAGRTKTLKVPIVIGLENEARDWLTVRASILHNLIGSTETSGKDETIANSTSVSAGATINMGKLKIDGIVGQDGSGNKKGRFGSTSRIALHYWY